MSSLTKVPLPMMDLDSHQKHSSLGPPKLTSHSISVGSAIFAWLMVITDRQTNRPHNSTVAIGRIQPVLQSGLTILTRAEQLLRWTTVWPQQAWAESWEGVLWGAGSPSNTMWPGPRPTSLPSGIFIHPTVWPQLYECHSTPRKNTLTDYFYT